MLFHVALETLGVYYLKWTITVIILGRAIGANLLPKWPIKILDGAKF